MLLFEISGVIKTIDVLREGISPKYNKEWKRRSIVIENTDSDSHSSLAVSLRAEDAENITCRGVKLSEGMRVKAHLASRAVPTDNCSWCNNIGIWKLEKEA